MRKAAQVVCQSVAGVLELSLPGAPQELEHTRQFWNKVFHSSPIVMSITTIGEGRFVELNEACAAIGGDSNTGRHLLNDDAV